VTVSLARGVNYLLGPLMEGFSGAWQKNIATESNENLLRFSAVYACINRIANDIATLRPMLMERRAGIEVEVENSAVPFLQVLRRPNPYMTWVQFLAYWMTMKLIHGNFYAIKDRDARGVVVALYPVDSRLAKPMVAGDGSVYYAFSGDNLARIPAGEAMLPASEVIHDRMNCFWHPLVGVPPIDACAASGTHGIRIQNNSATFFQNMSRPSGHLAFAGKVDDEQLKLLKKQFEEGFSGGNLGRLLVTGGDAKYVAMTIPAEQAQLIEQLKWTVEDIARAFSVPLHKLQAGAAPTFSNIGALNQGYYDDALKVHIEAIEALLTHELGLPVKYTVELELEGLLRMDPKTRAETMDALVKAGILAPNEGRAREGLLPVEGGDSPMIQQQNFSLAALAKRDAQEDPFGTAKPEPALPAPEDEEDPEEDDDAAEEEARAFLDTIAKGFELDTTV
jgi:HK97 family phage portal protein